LAPLEIFFSGDVCLTSLSKRQRIHLILSLVCPLDSRLICATMPLNRAVDYLSRLIEGNLLFPPRWLGALFLSPLLWVFSLLFVKSLQECDSVDSACPSLLFLEPTISYDLMDPPFLKSGFQRDSSPLVRSSHNGDYVSDVSVSSRDIFRFIFGLPVLMKPFSEVNRPLSRQPHADRVYFSDIFHRL